MFGIHNCDSVKRARVWLNSQGIAHNFHDFKKTGVKAEEVAHWVEHAGLDKVLNRNGTLTMHGLGYSNGLRPMRTIQ